MSRSFKVLAALALAGASVLGATAQASADPNPNIHGSAPQWVQLVTPNHVGVYSSPDAGSSKIGNITLNPYTDYVWADCWVSGGYVGSAGNVWYRTEDVWQNGGEIGVGVGWTFGPYVDYATVFHNVSPQPSLPHC